ncbi:MAG: CPBP family glutamic-type intramembrane protease [Planctomycetota bacterium]|jgi:membrane protease YdiL (CAAX protease family)
MPRRPAPAPVDYVARTRELPVNLLFLLPWLVVYELCLFASRSPVENAAGAWVKTLLRAFGREGLLTLTLLACLLMCLVLLHRIKEAPRDRGLYGGMLAEGLLYGAVLGAVAKVLASHLPLGRMVPLAAPDGAWIHGLRDNVQRLGLAVGAGIFEELVFRGLVLVAILWLLRHALGTDRLSAAFVALFASAWIFSSYHHWGAGGEPYDQAVFAFRFWAGIALGTLFLTRGLGIAAFAHGFYDALVLVAR